MPNLNPPATLSMRERFLSVLSGRRPLQLPFIDRIEPWYGFHTRQGSVPAQYAGLSLTEVHRRVGLGQQRFVAPFSLKLNGVEAIIQADETPVVLIEAPVLDGFAMDFADLVPRTHPGESVISLGSRAGKLEFRFRLTEELIAVGASAYMVSHPLRDVGDFQVLEQMLEHAEYLPQYERLRLAEHSVGGHGYVVPLLPRIPFQQCLLDYLGEVALSYALYDNPGLIARLMALLDQWMRIIIRELAELEAPYVELADNLHGGMTNHRLFRRFCLTHYQEYTQTLHSQGKKVGSHTDGDLKSLLGLIAESGLDVCESVSPSPLTSCTFEEIWSAWRHGPIIWGGIPSPILESRTPEDEFRRYVERLFETIGDGAIVLGIGDMVLGNNEIERVHYIAERVEAGLAGEPFFTGRRLRHV